MNENAVYSILSPLKRYAIYGSGYFADQLLKLIEAKGWIKPDFVFDGKPFSRNLGGFPVIPLVDVKPSSLSNIVLASDTHADDMRTTVLSHIVETQGINIVSFPTDIRGAAAGFDEEGMKIRKLRGIHAGRRAVVIGNGPSLKIPDLDRLNDNVTFASNKIFLAFDRTFWRPSYYTVIDDLVAEQNRDAIRNLDLVKIFPGHFKKIFGENDRIFWTRNLSDIVDGVEINRFSCDAAVGLYGGRTVLYHQIQMAAYMGAKEIVLIGVDFDFPNKGKDTGRKCAHGTILESCGEINHFHPDYRKPGELWTIPRLDLQERAFAYACGFLAQKGVRLVNASRQTKLTVVPRVDFDALFPDPGREIV